MKELRRGHWLIRLWKLNNSKISSIIQLSLAEYWIWRIETGIIGEHDGSSRVYPLSDNIRLSNQILAQQRKIELPFYKGEFGRREKTRMLRTNTWSRCPKLQNSEFRIDTDCHDTRSWKGGVGKNENLAGSKLESLKFETFMLNWKVSREVEKSLLKLKT